MLASGRTIRSLIQKFFSKLCSGQRKMLNQYYLNHNNDIYYIFFLNQPPMYDTLTAIIVSGGKLGTLVAASSTVAGLHFELVPGGLTQLTEE